MKGKQLDVPKITSSRALIVLGWFAFLMGAAVTTAENMQIAGVMLWAAGLVSQVAGILGLKQGVTEGNAEGPPFRLAMLMGRAGARAWPIPDYRKSAYRWNNSAKVGILGLILLLVLFLLLTEHLK